MSVCTRCNKYKTKAKGVSLLRTWQKHSCPLSCEPAPSRQPAFDIRARWTTIVSVFSRCCTYVQYRGTCLKTFYARCRALGTVEILSRGNIGKGKRTHALYEELSLTRSNGTSEAWKKREKKMTHAANIVLQMPRNAYTFVFALPLSKISDRSDRTPFISNLWRV